jgi:uncharacterized protein (TIRG00374 family)
LKRLLFWISLAISLVGLWLALRTVEFDKLGAVMVSANYGWLIPALVFHFLTIATRSERWRMLLGTDTVDSLTAFLVMNLGYLVMNVVPLGRIGDAVRAIIIDQRCGVGVPRALSTVVVERVLDVLVVTLGLVLVIPFMRVPPEAVQWVRGFGALGLLAIVGIVILITQRALTERILMAVLARFPRLSSDPWLARWRNLMSGFNALSSARGVLVVCGWTLATWVTGVGVFWAVMQAFFPGTSPLVATFLLSVESFAMAAPAAPGNWGVYELVAKEGLVIPFGFPEQLAIGYALVLHLFEFLALNLVGVIALIHFGLTLSDITAKAESVER